MKTKEKILNIFKANNEKMISGSMIANKLGVSRNAIWKNINSLKKDGYNIVSVKNKGYILKSGFDFLNEDEIKKHLTTNIIAKDIEILEDVNSTITYAKNLPYEKKKDGYLVVANNQSAGRGRYDRKFYCQKDSGIYLGLLLRPTEIQNISYITIMAGISVASAIEKLYGIEAKIKWVNDVFIEDKKICGILTEGIISVESGSIDSVIVGIGINVNKIKSIPKELESIVGYINDFTGKNENRNKLIAQILNTFEEFYLNFNVQQLYSEYKKRMLYIGKSINVIDGNKKRKGILYRLNKDFSISVDFDDGDLKNFSTGEISLCKAKEF